MGLLSKAAGFAWGKVKKAAKYVKKAVKSAKENPDLKAELASLKEQVSAAAANTLSRIGAGATNAATEALDPGGGKLNVPVSKGMMLAGAAVLVLLLALVAVLARRPA